MEFNVAACAVGIFLSKECCDWDIEGTRNGMQGIFRYPLCSLLDPADVSDLQTGAGFHVCHGQVSGEADFF